MSDDAIVMAYEPEEVYEYDDPVEFEIEQLKNEAGSYYFHYSFTGWPLGWKTQKYQGIWQLSGKCQGFY